MTHAFLDGFWSSNRLVVECVKDKWHLTHWCLNKMAVSLQMASLKSFFLQENCYINSDDLFLMKNSASDQVMALCQTGDKVLPKWHQMLMCMHNFLVVWSMEGSHEISCVILNNVWSTKPYKNAWLWKEHTCLMLCDLALTVFGIHQKFSLLSPISTLSLRF